MHHDTEITNKHIHHMYICRSYAYVYTNVHTLLLSVYCLCKCCLHFLPSLLSVAMIKHSGLKKPKRERGVISASRLQSLIEKRQGKNLKPKSWKNAASSLLPRLIFSWISYAAQDCQGNDVTHIGMGPLISINIQDSPP